MTRSFMVVGSLNRKTPYFDGARGVGLSVFAFDPESGSARLVCEERGIDNPTFLCVDPATRCVYANSEVPSWLEGTVTAYRFEPAEGRLTYINKQASQGSITAHCSLASGRQSLLVANYGGFPEGLGPDRALTVFPIREDGGLAPPASSVSRRGCGSDPMRQDRSHPHCVLPSPDGRFAMMSDLGHDALACYALGPDGTLSGEPVGAIQLKDGSGPRHFTFHPNGRLVVVICELDSTISSLCFDPSSGRLDVVSTVSTLPQDGLRSHCSDVVVHPNGRRIYGANRGHDSIVVVAIDPDGTLTVLGHTPSGGRTPRHLALDPECRNLVAANQDGDVLSVHPLDRDGTPKGEVGQIAVGTPMCVAFLQ